MHDSEFCQYGDNEVSPGVISFSCKELCWRSAHYHWNLDRRTLVTCNTQFTTIPYWECNYCPTPPIYRSAYSFKCTEPRLQKADEAVDLVCAVLNFVDLDSFGSESKQLQCIVSRRDLRYEDIPLTAIASCQTGAIWIQLDSIGFRTWDVVNREVFVQWMYIVWCIYLFCTTASGLKAWIRFGCFSSFA